MTAPVFVDTNVLVYARDTAEPEKCAAAEAWLSHLWKSGAGRVSPQVLREYYVTVTRKLDPSMTPAKARLDVRNLLTWSRDIAEGPVLEQAWRIEDRHEIAWWDALIVGAAFLMFYEGPAASH